MEEFKFLKIFSWNFCKGPTESCPQGGWREQNPPLSIEKYCKGAKSSFYVIYTLLNNDKCLFFAKLSENVNVGSKWVSMVNLVQNEIFCLKKGYNGPGLPEVDKVA